LAAGDTFALAPQVLAEFLHIVTDARRFANPLEMSAAIALSDQWWTAQEVAHVFPGESASRQFLNWMQQHRLGRKRLLDTLLAATYWQAGISSVLTTNPADFGVFGCFQCVVP
jgi:predicted nucleic acid-binding protein